MFVSTEYNSYISKIQLEFRSMRITFLESVQVDKRELESAFTSYLIFVI